MNKVEIGNFTTILNEHFIENSYSKIVVIADESTIKHCYSLLIDCLPAHEIIQIASGESNKNINTCLFIWDKMTSLGLDRHSLVINLGGGVIGDMGGFCAATYKRGVNFIQMPTTLLSQVDASVGGKLGIDFQSFKNHIGVFKIPNLVLIDPVFLKTLPVSELRSGFAEIIKHCLIADGTMWQKIIENNYQNQDYSALINHSVAIKSKITEADPTEKGIRKILNFGHTLGHAIETFYLDTPNHLLHGEAIAVGMITEAYLSFTSNKISKIELDSISNYIISNYGLVKIQNTDFESIISLTLQDKKNRNGEVRFSLLNGIGNCDFDIAISKQQMAEALEYYANLG